MNTEKEIIVLNFYNILCTFGMWYFDTVGIRLGFAFAGICLAILLIIKLSKNK